MRYVTSTMCAILLVAGASRAAWADTKSADAALGRGGYAQARSLYAAPAKAGDAHAQYELGRLLLNKGDLARACV